MNRIEFVLVLLFTFFVIVVWVTSDVILVKPNTPDDPKIQTMIEPLNPVFDQETLQLIGNRTLSTPIKATPRPVVQPSSNPTETIPAQEPSSQPSGTPQPTINPIEAGNNINEIITTEETQSPQPLATNQPAANESPTP